jgi:hypothetical protein
MIVGPEIISVDINGTVFENSAEGTEGLARLQNKSISGMRNVDAFQFYLHI